jgi:hypothetical protein
MKPSVVYQYIYLAVILLSQGARYLAMESRFFFNGILQNKLLKTTNVQFRAPPSCRILFRTKNTNFYGKCKQV